MYYVFIISCLLCRMKYRIFILGLILFSIPQWVLAQHVVSGKVSDSVTGASLAFVNIVVNDNDYGGSTDIDGNFYFKSTVPIQSLTFTFVGYHTKIINVNPALKSMRVLMVRRNIELSGVEIFPGENPAYAIIRKVQKNRKLNDPLTIPSFRYKCYNKVTAEWYLDKTKYSISSDPDSKLKDDSTFLRLNRQAEEQYIMMMEAYSERIYLNGKSQENVLGTRVSGFSDPNFTTLATDIQPFS